VTLPDELAIGAQFTLLGRRSRVDKILRGTHRKPRTKYARTPLTDRSPMLDSEARTDT
jgi:hypothetical protein